MTSLKPPRVLLQGVPGSGKTYSLVTLLDAGITPFVLATESGASEVIYDALAAHGRSADEVHISYVPPAAPGWEGLKTMLDKVAMLNYELLASEKSGIGKRDLQQLFTFLDRLRDFRDDRTGEHFGDVTEFDDSRALVIDSLSGLNALARRHTVGLKPSLHQGEWGVAMQLEIEILNQLVDECKCMFILLAHLDREMNELTGSPINTVAALGRKNAPQILKTFGDVVSVKRKGGKFIWSTSEEFEDVKNRTLPISDSLPPSFEPIVRVYRERKALEQQSA